MVRFIKASTNSMSRSELIDYLDDNYNTQSEYENLESAIADITGIDVNHIDDSDPNEGMYAHISTEELHKIIDKLKSSRSTVSVSLDLTTSELSYLKKIVSMFTEPSFSKSSEDSELARTILRELDN